MAETLAEEITTEKNTVEDSTQTRLEKFLHENDVKVFTEKDFDFPKNEKKQAKIRAEVDEFLQMREAAGKLSKDLKIISES